MNRMDMKQAARPGRMLPGIGARGRERAGLLVVLLACLLFSLGGPAFGQVITNDDARFERKLQEADRNLHGGNAERALRLFEELLATRPESKKAFIGVVSARVRLHRLEGLEALAEERLRAHPGDRDLAILLGEVRFAEGRREDAVATWRSAAPLFDSADQGTREVARRMEAGRMFQEAIAFLLEGREALGDPFLFADDLCRLHMLTGDGDASAAEWVRAAAGGTKKEGEALRAIHELKDSGEIEAYPLDLLRSILVSLPSARGVREILADLALADGRCAEAFREARALDEGQPKRGRFLLSFAKGAIEKGCLDEAAEGARTIVRASDEAGTRLEASFLLARIERSAGNAERAAETYRSIAEGTKNPKEKENARLELANVLLDDLGEPEGAIPILDEMIRRGLFPEKEIEIRFTLARARLLAGEAEGAMKAYDELVRIAPDDAVRERAVFETGRAHFFAGRMDEALAEYRRVIDQYPLGRYLNDALSQSIFISENRDAGDAPLAEYAACLLLIDRKELAEARSRLASMLETLAVAKIRDDLAWQLAGIEEREGRFREAVARYERLTEEFPGERLAESASVRTADLYAAELGNLREGIARYEKFLLDYPGSVLIEEVRRKKAEAERRLGS